MSNIFNFGVEQAMLECTTREVQANQEVKFQLLITDETDVFTVYLPEFESWFQ
jgi:hypothetical protein